LQFSLNWDAPTDVDLWVTEPNGERIYFGNTTSASGGTLDLDSNAGCSIDNVNNENITWGSVVPPLGDYLVQVDHWSDCNGNTSNYTLTANMCGETTSYNGTLVGNQTDTVDTLTFTNCAGAVASGKVFYQDFKPTINGLGTTGVYLPVTLADIVVKRISDDEILASGTTDSSGEFRLEFNNTGTKGYYVEVAASQENGNKNIVVKNTAATVYTFKSAEYDEVDTPENTGIVLNIDKADNAGAFNIFDMGIKGAATIRRYAGVSPQKVPFIWPGAGSTSYWNGSELHILSSTDDADEYDDMVILHEYGHYYQAIYSVVSSGTYLRGCHSTSWAERTHKAWSEGMATFFAGAVKGTPQYIDTFKTSGSLFDMESAQSVPKGVYSDFTVTNACSSTVPATITTKTQSQDQEDWLSEGLVSAILWDIYDTSNSNESYDTISNKTGVFKSFDSLSESWVDIIDPRTAIGVDLVDFLDDFCTNNKGRGTATTGIEGIMSQHQFPYDFASTCQ